MLLQHFSCTALTFKIIHAAEASIIPAYKPDYAGLEDYITELVDPEYSVINAKIMLMN